jgi:hypothetical protein
MRVTRTTVWSIAVIVSASILAFAIVFQLAKRPDGKASSVATSSFVAASASDDRRPHFKAETRKQLGRFRVGRGKGQSRLVGISSATTDDGSECLIEEDVDGEASSCLDDGFFALRKAEVVVSTSGGPDRFDELYVAGVVAPGIRTARVVTTDGSEVATELSSARAFVYESPAEDLEARVYPTAVRLYGPSGRLVDTVAFPPAG